MLNLSADVDYVTISCPHTFLFYQFVVYEFYFLLDV